MTSLFSTALFLFVAAITPGPNNLVVMRTATRAGWLGALPAVAGVVAGGLTLLIVVVFGAGNAFIAWPWLCTAIDIGGVCYLVWLGVRLFIAAGRDYSAKALPAGLPGLFGFQFLNPKGWVMVLTVVAALHAADPADALRHLVPLFIVIPAFCLLLWAGLGGGIARYRTRPAVRLWTDRTLGALLVVAALLLFV